MVGGENNKAATLGVIAIMLLGLATSGCHERRASAAARVPVVHVETVEVARRPMPRYLTVTGTLAPNQQSELAADTVGKIVTVSVERGTLVKRGDVIARVDPTSAKLKALEASGSAVGAAAQQRQAEEDCKKNADLLASGSISRVEYDRGQARCQALRGQAASVGAGSALASKGRSDTNIRAPFTGLIAERHVSVGEYVRPETSVVTLVDMDAMRLVLTIPESVAPSVVVGQRVLFAVPAVPRDTFGATVRYVGPIVRGTSRDLVVEAIVDPAQKAGGAAGSLEIAKDGREPQGPTTGALRPGMFVTARILLEQKPVSVVPVSAVADDGDLHRVFVVTPARRVEERIVQLGERVDASVAVLDGLRAGERVVVKPEPTLADGAQVE